MTSKCHSSINTASSRPPVLLRRAAGPFCDVQGGRGSMSSSDMQQRFGHGYALTGRCSLYTHFQCCLLHRANMAVTRGFMSKVLHSPGKYMRYQKDFLVPTFISVDMASAINSNILFLEEEYKRSYDVSNRTLCITYFDLVTSSSFRVIQSCIVSPLQLLNQVVLTASLKV